MTLINSTFKNNSASTNAGVIYSKNINLFMNNCSFLNNSAFEGDAGALYLDCEDTL